MTTLDKSSYHRTARKTWEATHGSRPRDENGARYHVHHRDGDHTNNVISNLLCVSPKTHRVIHNGTNHMVRSSDLINIKEDTTPEFLDGSFTELVDLLVLVMEQTGTEINGHNGGMDGWEDLLVLPDDALDDDETFDVLMEKAHRFIFQVAYPVALTKL